MQFSKFRKHLITATALSGTLVSTAAWADCVAGAGSLSTLVTCDSPGGLGTNGYNTTASDVTVQVLSSGVIDTPPTPGAPLLSAGANSVVTVFSGSVFDGTYGIDAGTFAATAISLGGGSTVNLTAGSQTRGSIGFGNATGNAINTVNITQSDSAGRANIDGNITSQGNTVINNQGYIQHSDFSKLTQTGTGLVVFNNGFQDGSAQATAWTDIDTEASTVINNRSGSQIVGNPASTTNFILGRNGTGITTVNNAGSISGSLELADSTNVINNNRGAVLNAGPVALDGANDTVTNDGTIAGDVSLNGTTSNVFNAGSLESTGDNGLRLPGAGTGTLAALASHPEGNTLNLNGVDVSVLQSGAKIQNFGTVNKNDSGEWVLQATLDGNAGKLANVNVNAGTLTAENAAFLGSAATTVRLASNTTLLFTGVTAGTFAGNIIDANGATNNQVNIVGLATTLSGNNTYSGRTTINGGTLITGSDGALSANSDYFLSNAAGITINNKVSVKTLSDVSGIAAPIVVNLAGTDTSITLTGGDWGHNGGTITGTGTVIKTGAGQFNLDGAGAVNLDGGTIRINDGSVTIVATDAIGGFTAVEVNSTASSAGMLDVNASDTIGSLSGTGSAARVNLGTGATLTTGGSGADTSFAGQIAGAGALTKTGTGQMVLTGANSYTGGTTVDAGEILGFAGSTATNGSLQGNIAVATDAFLTFDQLLNPNGNGSATYAGNLSGAGMVKVSGNSAGTAVLTLTGDNSALSGTMTFFDKSVVSIGADRNLGTGLLVFRGATLVNTADVTLANAIDLRSNLTLAATGGGATFQTDAATTLALTGDITGVSGLTKTGTGTLVLSGTNTYTGGTTISSGILQGDAGKSIQGDIVNNAEIDLTGNEVDYGGDISGSGKLKVINNSVVFLDGTNTYTGTTTIDEGSVLAAAGDHALSSKSAFIVNGGLTLFGGGISATIGSLAGNGTIDLQGSALYIGADNSSTTFAGTITADPTFAASDVNKVGTGTLTLSGTGSVVTGSLVAQGGTLAITGSGSLSAGFTGVTTGSTLSLDGHLTSPTVLVGVGGRLIGGVGTTPATITGAVTNAGTVAPGHSPGIISIDGSYTQTATGTLTVDVGGNGTSTVVAGTDYDRIVVTGTPGTATLAGTLAVVQNGGVYIAGTAYDIITATGGITGDFTTVTGNVISPFITLSNATANGGGKVGNNYRLVVVRSAYRTVATNPNQAAVANGLQSLVGVSNAASTVGKIDNLSATQARIFFDQVSPEAYGAYATALQDQGDLFTRQVDHRLASAENDGSKGLWVNGYSQWTNGKNRDFRFGSDQDTTGFAVGVDFGNEFVTFGIAGGYSEDKVTYVQRSSSGKSKAWQVGGYASFAQDALHADAQVAYISSNIDATKSISAGAGATQVTGTASASTDGHVFRALGTVGYDLGTKEFKLRPFVGIDFTSGHVNGFTESGAGALDLTVGEINANRTDVVGGVKFAAALGTITPYVNATYRYHVNHNARLVTALFDGQPGSAFTVETLLSGRSQFDLDAGLNAKVGDKVSVFLGYQGTFRNDVESHGLNGGVRVAF